MVAGVSDFWGALYSTNVPLLGIIVVLPIQTLLSRFITCFLVFVMVREKLTYVDIIILSIEKETTSTCRPTPGINPDSICSFHRFCLVISHPFIQQLL